MVAAKMVVKCGIVDVGVSCLNCEKGVNPGLSLLVDLYIERCYPLWKESEVSLWLKSGIDSFARLVKSGVPKFMTVISNGKTLREERYTGSIPLNVLRHVFISEYGSVTASIPSNYPSQSLV